MNKTNTAMLLVIVTIVLSLVLASCHLFQSTVTRDQTIPASNTEIIRDADDNDSGINNVEERLSVAETPATDYADDDPAFVCPSSLTDEDFVVEDDNTFIELGGKYVDIKTNEKVIDSREPTANHAYGLVRYENFLITTGVDDIGSIHLTTSILKTNRGISVGDSISDVFEKYGTVEIYTFSNYRSLNYNNNGKLLKFDIVDEKISLIVLECV